MLGRGSATQLLHCNSFRLKNNNSSITATVMPMLQNSHRKLHINTKVGRKQPCHELPVTGYRPSFVGASPTCYFRHVISCELVCSPMTELDFRCVHIVCGKVMYLSYNDITRGCFGSYSRTVCSVPCIVHIAVAYSA